MKYRVVLTEPAKNDIRDYVRFISVEQRSPAQARKWSRDLRTEVAKLTYLADKFNVIEEGLITQRPTRSFHFHSHRVIYKIDYENLRAVIIRIYHGSRQPLQPSDFQDFNL